MTNEHSAATLNLDQTGECRKGKTEATFGIGIQKENELTKSNTVKCVENDTQVEGLTTQKE